MFTRGGSAPGGVASTHARQAVILCTDPHMRVQRTATPTLRPAHTLKCESTRIHRARTPSQAAPWSPGCNPLPPPLGGPRHLGRCSPAAPQFPAGLPSTVCPPLKRPAEKWGVYDGS